MIESGDLNLNEIIFSDETHIHLNGSPNKQNCRKWSTSKPSFNFSVPLHLPKITVWCGMSSEKIYGPFFFEDSETGEATTVTANRCQRILEIVFDDNGTSRWFQQDGAPAHTATVSMDWLRQKLPEKLISIKDDFPWLVRFPDLSPLDFSPLGVRKR